MGRFSDGDPEYLRTDQYADDRNLAARIALHERFTTDPEPFHRWLFDRIELPAQAEILEVGCGPAKLWAENLDRIPAGWSLTLTDFSPGMLEAASRTVGGDDRFCFECCDAQRLTFDSDRFDGLFANHMLYHVPDRDCALAEFARVLRADGTLFASANGGGHLREINELVEVHAGGPRHDLEFAANFSLENGAALIGRHFETVREERREAELRVTEVEPLLAFVRASWSAEDLTEEGVARMREAAADAIHDEGAFVIGVCAGVFTARGPLATPRTPPGAGAA